MRRPRCSALGGASWRSSCSRTRGLVGAALLSGLVLMVGGALAAGADDRREVGCWSAGIRAPSTRCGARFVWRNELADTFVEMVAAPWFARPATGTRSLNVWLRSLGARVGRGVWCETYWLPEADLVELRDGVTVNRGCVVQTHLFHDRVMSMDAVSLRAGSTLGPEQRDPARGGARPHATVGPGVAGDEGRVRARQDPLDRQPDRPLARRRRPTWPAVVSSARPTGPTTTSRARRPVVRRRCTTTSTCATSVEGNRLDGRATLRCRAARTSTELRARPAPGCGHEGRRSTATAARSTPTAAARLDVRPRRPAPAGRASSRWRSRTAASPRPVGRTARRRPAGRSSPTA